MESSRKKEHGLAGILKALQTLSLRFHSGLVLVGGLWLFLIMFQVFGDVTGRYLFSRPVPGTFALGVMMLVVLVYLGATYTEVTGGHIRVSIFSDRLSRRWQTLLDILFLVGGATIAPLLTWQTFSLALHSWQIREVALDYPIPIYPGKFAICVGFFFLSIQFLLNLSSKLFELMNTGREKDR